jgi:hypothetical protein
MKNHIKYSKAISWFSDCRIPYVDGDHVLKYEGYSNGEYKSEYEGGTSYKYGNQVQINTQGRFPANILVSDDMLNDGVVTKSLGGNSTNIGGFVTTYSDETKRGMKSGFGDKGTNSRYYDIDKWFNNLLE